MAKIYYLRIKADKMTLEDVPELWRSAVQALLYSEAGNIL